MGKVSVFAFINYLTLQHECWKSSFLGWTSNVYSFYLLFTFLPPSTESVLYI